MLAEQLGEGGFAAADIAGKDNQTLIFFRVRLIYLSLAHN